eukprot:2549212-Lingulodinium_polyedra.AAC.1
MRPSLWHLAPFGPAGIARARGRARCRSRAPRRVLASHGVGVVGRIAKSGRLRRPPLARPVRL